MVRFPLINYEHTNESIEVAVILIADVAAESRSAFAVKCHQFRESDGVADSLFVTGDCLFGFYDGRILIAQYLRPEPAIERFLVGLQHVLAQSKAGVKKSLIVLVGSV